MPEYGNYEEKIRTLGELRKFVNETLKGLEDEYTFNIDDDLTGVDITLYANCDVSYSEREFYWTTSSHWYSDLEEVVAKKEKLKRKARAFDIVFEKNVNTLLLELAENVDEYNERILPNELKLTQDEFDLLKEMTMKGANRS